MKRLSAVSGLAFSLAATFAIVFLSQAEPGNKRPATTQQKTSAKHEIHITDQNGNPVVSGRPSGTGQIVDVQVGPAFAFDPSTVDINVGDTVRWTWAGSGHSVTSGPPCEADSQYCSPDDQACASGILSNTGTVYTHTFDQPGVYDYFCAAHCTFGMIGTVNVSGGCAPSGWTAGPDLPSVGTRLAGVYFQPNGNFYGMGGRSSDVAGSDFTNPFEFDPGANSWAIKSATYPDNEVNNMACGELSVDGTSYIYCVGGSAAGATTATARVFRYDPVADTIETLDPGDNWPGDIAGTILPGGFTVLNNRLYILGGFNINVSATSEIWEFDPTVGVGAKWTQKVDTPEAIMYAPTCAIDGTIYVAGASDFDTVNLLVIDTTNSFSFDPVANTIGSIAPIPRATGETRALTFNGQMYVMGGGRVAPNPSNEVDIYDPVSNSWTTGDPFINGRRNFPTDTDGTSRIWLVGGYDVTGVPVASMEIFCAAGGPTPSPTPTPTVTPTVTPPVTPTPTVTPSVTPSVTPTVTPSVTPSPSPTPSEPPPSPTPRVTPRPRPTPFPRPTP